jgi:AraC-like DNA-binding protein
MESDRKKMTRMVPLSTISALIAGLNNLGFDTESLLGTIGVSQDDLEAPFSMVPNEYYEKLWMLAVAKDPSPDLPSRAAMVTPFGAFGLVDHLSGSAQTVGEGLVTLQFYFRFVASTLELQIEHTDGDWVWILNREESKTLAMMTDLWSVSMLINRFQMMTNGFQVDKVALTQPAFIPSKSFTRDMMNAAIMFNQPMAGIKLGTGVWNLRSLAANPSLHKTLKLLAEREEIKSFENTPISIIVQRQFPDALQSGKYSAEHIAKSLNLSLRTFQRYLAGEQVTFRQLLDDYRKEETIRMLKQGDYSITEIVHSLGYREQSSFNRAFKRWTGITPSAWIARSEGNQNDMT